ncbi:glycoside hydrolase family 9 protein [Ruminococcus flavefaciens]|uniref:Endoglucanase n=1 Tax=Ruminococcus flavefaciens TaxID=1265 RepID=A0A1M7ILF5_RUMFL|nr:glycoside hydrolase family 9 protein [Ruminococcus flavefaciens]SHM41475.1 Carbohydrate binding domain-containing protein [Ruminococcus flavefaciens]
MHKKTKKLLASVMAMATIAPAAVATIAPMTASAGLVVGESTFDHKALPWHTCESSPAKQNFELTKDGTFHVMIKVPEGADHEKWDLQFRHRNLAFKAGHEYKVSFKVKAKRAGMELCSKIGDISGNEEYFELDGGSNDMHMGPHMGGQWPQAAVKLTTDWQTFEGTFKPTEDLEAAEWCFHYAKGTKYQGNAEANDEIWFDDMVIDCVTCGDKAPGEGCCNADPDEGYGATNRDYSAKFDSKMKEDGELVNFISVNQIGYFTNFAKTATLGDNKGDILHGASTIDLSGTYTWELVDAKSGTVVETGETGSAMKDADSADTVCKIDFSKATTAGRYYLRIKGKNWRSMEFNIGDDIYTDKSHDMLKNALNYFYQNRSGIDIDAKYITSGDTKTLAHEGGHKTDKAYVQKIWKNEYLENTEATSTYASSTITANKGWYDAGDHGKYVVNGGISIWTLLNMYERATFNEKTAAKFADGSGTVNIPESGDSKKIPDIIDECLYELEFMTAMKVDSSEPTWGKYAGMVYHKLHDHKWTGLATRPWDYSGEKLEDGSKGWNTERIVKPPTFAATLNYSACSAQMARLIKPYDEEKSAFYLKEAIAAYEAAEKNYYPADSDEEHNEKSLYAPMLQAKGGGPYGDNEVKDDFYWAACEIFTSAKILGDSAADTYLTKLSDYTNAFKVPVRITGGENKDGSFTALNWGNTNAAGSLSLLLHPEILTDEQYSTLKKSVLATADEYIKEEEKQGYGIPYKYDGNGYTDENNLDPDIVIYGYEWGSNSMVINNLMVMSYAYDLSGQDAKYMNGVLTGMNYLLGCNPLSFSYVTGYGTYMEKNPHHRYWSHELDKTLPMAPDGVLSGGPNAGLQDPYVRALGFVPGKKDNPSQRCFVDSIEAWSTNEVTINWNAPLAWIVEFLQDKEATYSYVGDPVPPTTTTTVTQPVVTTTVTNPIVTPGATVWGDANCDGEVDMGDIVLIMQSLANPNKYGEGGSDKSAITAQGKANADVDISSKGITTQDAVRIQNFLLNKISSLDPTK